MNKKRIILLLALLIGVGITGAAQSDVTQLRNLYHRAWKAMIEKDLDAMQQVYAEGYVQVQLNGKVQQRNAYLSDIMDSTFNYFHEYTKDKIEVRLTELGQAELTAHSEIEAAMMGSSRRTWHLTMQMRAVRRESGWVFTHCRVTQQ